MLCVLFILALHIVSCDRHVQFYIIVVSCTECLPHTMQVTSSLTVFTALHGMQSQYSDGNSVCLSVCLSVRLAVRLSNACIVTKRKKAMFRFLYHMREHLS